MRKSKESLPLVGRVLHREEEIRPVEAGRKAEGGPEAEIPDDIFLYLPCRGGGQGQNDRACLETGGKIADPPVGGAELAAPVGDAVGFVDDKEGDVCIFRI